MAGQLQISKKIEISKVSDECSLYFAQTPTHIPFPIKRIFFITETYTLLPRGYHAHKKTKQVLFCIQGSIKIIVDDGKKREEIILDSPEEGIFLDRMTWIEMHDFKEDTILLVLASRLYKKSDYIRDYHLFHELAKKENDKA